MRGRRLLYILESIARRAGWGPLFREASRRLLKVVHYGSLRWESRPLEALYMPEAPCSRGFSRTSIGAGRLSQLWRSGGRRGCSTPSPPHHPPEP